MVGEGVPGGGHAVGRLLQRQVKVAVRPGAHGRAGGALPPVNDRGDGVGVAGRAGGIQVVGGIGHGGEFFAVFVQDEIGAGQAGGAIARNLAAQQTPTQKHAVFGRQCDKPAAERLKLGAQHTGDGGRQHLAFG